MPKSCNDRDCRPFEREFTEHGVFITHKSDRYLVPALYLRIPFLHELAMRRYDAWVEMLHRRDDALAEANSAAL